MRSVKSEQGPEEQGSQTAVFGQERSSPSCRIDRSKDSGGRVVSIEAVLANERAWHIECGDCLEVMADVSDGSAHLIVTSPPYNLDQPYDEHDDKMDVADYVILLQRFLLQSERILSDGGRLCINVGENKRSENGDALPTYCVIASFCSSMHLLYRGTLIWYKANAANRCAWGSWLSPSNPHVVPSHEYILVYSKGRFDRPDRSGPGDCSAEEFKRLAWGMWTFKPETRLVKDHPCPFPVELPRRLIKFYTWPGDVVVDPFCGIGSTGVACRETDRRFVGAELSESYVTIARERIIEAETGLTRREQAAGQETLFW